ncbi:hypothetical protein AMAG_02819 [Allomyces macrogynus ATCC 38327]|uniref:Exocyst complex component SEC15 n=1 Tax=Allomyces macrogynus (strain ATCC 38327) TaxID=578462 RepID=A0A0L0S3E9_ALLM3|nr:hypothetical protein AMAG_02819 [Allomyces macrogynus ATCC 38327]|eukprot:KNE57062.1 hypothetical protein AMAG_02819 [Allomyces macrogynus ATCC 38327]
MQPNLPAPRVRPGGLLGSSSASIPLGGRYSQSQVAASAGGLAAAAPAGPSAPPVDLINVDDLDQLGPLIKSLLRSGKEDRYMDQLKSYIAVQDAEIERLCNSNYQEFLQSVDQLLKVRVETVELKTQLTQLTEEFNTAVKSSVDKKKELIQRRKIYANLENALEAVSQCLAVLDLALRANSLFAARKYYSSLRCLDDIRSKLGPIQQFEVAKYLGECLPKMQENVRMAVNTDLRDWFVTVRENSRAVGQVATDMMVTATRRAAMSSNGYKGSRMSVAISAFGLEDDGLQNVMDNDQVHVDFKPLYQSIHIHGVMGRLPDLMAEFEEQRRLQANLFLAPKFTLAQPAGWSALEPYLQDVTGFFLLERTILNTTSQFRSRAAVDLLWDQTVTNITNLVNEFLATGDDPAQYLRLQAVMMPFIQTLQMYSYLVNRLVETMATIFERYTDLMKQSCSEKLHQAVEEDDCVPVTVHSPIEHDSYKSRLHVSDPSDTVPPPLPTPAGTKPPPPPYPRNLPYSKVVPTAADLLYAFVDGYYKFATNLASADTGNGDVPTVVAAADADDLVRRSVDALMMRYLRDPLGAIIDASTNLAQILQILVNVAWMARLAGALERALMEKRLMPSSSRVVLQAGESFKQCRKTAEKRIFELLNHKISDFLGLAEYDFMPPADVARSKMPSPYLRDLVNFLTTVMYSTLENLPSEIKTFIYFEAFDHLANGMLDLILAPTVRRINLAFVDQFATDVSFLERFVNGLGDQNVQDTFLVLRQAVTLMVAEHPTEVLDPAVAHKRYSRLKRSVMVQLLEKLNNAAGMFAARADKAKRKEYETVIMTLKKEIARSPSPTKTARAVGGGSA